MKFSISSFLTADGLLKGGDFIAGKRWKHRIRPKVRTVDVIGLPVPVQAPNPYEVLGDYWCVPLRYDAEDEARRAYDALCAASK